MKSITPLFLLASVVASPVCGAGERFLFNPSSSPRTIHHIQTDEEGAEPNRWFQPIPPMTVAPLLASDPPRDALPRIVSEDPLTIEALNTRVVVRKGRVELTSTDNGVFGWETSALEWDIESPKGIALSANGTPSDETLTILGDGSVLWQSRSGLETEADVALSEITHETYGIPKESSGRMLSDPRDWILARPSDADEGGWVVTTESEDGLRIEDGRSIQTVGSGGVLRIAPASNRALAWEEVFRGGPSILLEPDGDGVWQGRAKDQGQPLRVRVTDRNRNHRPDTEEDLWVFSADENKGLLVAFSHSDDARRAAVFPFTAGVPDETELDETGGARGNRFAKALDSIGASSPEERTAVQTDLRLPAIILEDFDGDGTFFEGTWLSGGFLGGDRAGKRIGDWSTAWDLDGDGLGDVFEYDPSMVLNFFNTFVSLLAVDLDPLAGTAGFEKRKGYDLQNYGSHFSKSPSASQFVGEAKAGFEEHFFVNLPADPDHPLFPNGAAFFYYTIGGGDVNRLTMGRLSGEGGLRAWEVELDPVPADPEKTEYNVIRWENTQGATLPLNTISAPPDWGGETLGIREALRGWYAMAEGEFATKSLFATFSPPGTQMGSSEGMYGGAYTTQERIEVDQTGGSYVLYHSPLMGDLHLKGADYGSYAVPAGTPDFWLDINRYYHREAHTGAERFVGAEPAVRFRAREAKRMEGPVFLSYRDQNDDGFFDQYLYDEDNDGIYDSTLSHRPENQTLVIANREFLAGWPESIDFAEIEYLPENYEGLAQLYQKGFPLAPMVIRAGLGSSGIPTIVESHPYFRERRPSAYVVLPPEWRVTAAVGYHAGNDPKNLGWKNFGPDGNSRIGTMVVENGLVQETMSGPWTSESLAAIDLLFLTRLEFTPDEKEIEALVEWLREGGLLIIAPETDPEHAIRFNVLGQALGYRFGESPIKRRTVSARWASLGPINRPDSRAAEDRAPGPWNEIAHFQSQSAPELLDGMDFLSFTALPIESLADGYDELLRYANPDDSDHVRLIAESNFGTGRILLCGADWFTNRFIWHHEFYEKGTSNERMADRLIRRMVRNLPVPQVLSVEEAEESVRAVVRGKGGTVYFPARYQPRATDLAHIGNNAKLPLPRELRAITVNGEETPFSRTGLLYSVPLPSGDSEVILHYTTKP